MAAKVRQTVIDRLDSLLQYAAELTCRVGSGIGAFGVDQVDHSLRLGQAELAVEKGPLGEFARSCLTGTGGKERLQPGSQHGRRTVALQLHRVLTGIAPGRTADHCHGLVDDTAQAVMEGAEKQSARRKLRQRLTTVRRKDLVRDQRAAFAGEPQDADGAGNLARCDSCDHITHGDSLLSSFNRSTAHQKSPPAPPYGPCQRATPYPPLPADSAGCCRRTGAAAGCRG